LELTNENPFEVIYTFTEHPRLGMFLECMAVKLTDKGNLSLAYQKVHEQTADYFGLSSEEKEAVIALDKTEPIPLMRKYYKGKKKIKTNEFIYHHLDNDLLRNEVRPYIEKNIGEAFDKLKGKRFFLTGSENPTHTELKISEKTDILFHIRRDPRGTIYFPTFKSDNEKIEISQNESYLITQNPARLLIKDSLLQFDESLDGKKIKPFLGKRFISIPEASVKSFFQKFLVPLVEQHNVFAKGVEIVTERHRATAFLDIVETESVPTSIELLYKYDDYLFKHDPTKAISAGLEEKDGTFIFHRIQRSKDWELQKADKLNSLGLKNTKESIFEPIHGDMNCVDWLVENREELEKAGIDLSLIEKTNYSIEKPKFSLKVDEDFDWFDVKIKVEYGEFLIPFIELKKYVLDGIRSFTLPNGKIGYIPLEWMSRLSEMEQFSDKKNKESYKIRNFHATSLGKMGDFKSNLHSKILQLAENGHPDEYDLPAKFKGTLRPYQKAGYDWMLTLANLQLGGILADDMGLGKTIQALAFISKSVEKSFSEYSGINLIVVPTSLVYNWMSEIKKFSPHLKVEVHQGPRRKNNSQDLEKLNADVILTSYGILRNDIEVFKELHFQSILLDEGQHIKNYKSATAKAIKKLDAHTKFTLTGTPIENSLNDLWSQMDFVNTGLLFSNSKFQELYLTPIEKKFDTDASIKLKSLISPFVLGRKKEQVAPELPEKSEQTLYCAMTEEQSNLYEKIKSEYRNELLEKIEDLGIQKSRMHILSGLMKLRQIANHPKMTDPESDIDSGKFEIVKEKIHNAVDSGHKILIFSQFVSHLELVREFLQSNDIDHSYLDGQTSQKARNVAVNEFQSKEERRVFLISLKAGGTGLNLQVADYVFMLDPWWNPAAERQAQDRAHRIGQTKNVIIYKFITKNTVEEKILQMQKKKTRISEEVIKFEDTILKSFDKKTIQELLN
jgi:SNF2 family DNA or RNA helicase